MRIFEASVTNAGIPFLVDLLKQLLIERSDQVMDTVLSNYQKLKMAATDNKITEKSVMQNVDLSLAQNIFVWMAKVFNLLATQHVLTVGRLRQNLDQI